MIEPSRDRDIQFESPYRSRVTIPFDVVNNLVVVQMRINDSAPLNFILDSGATRIILTEIPDGEELTLNFTREVLINGLGNEAPKEALLSLGNNVFMKEVKGTNQDVIFLHKHKLDLSSFMGMPIHGILGYNLFQDFVVELNYQRERLVLHHPDVYQSKFNELKKSKKWHYLPITVEGRKPYVEAQVLQENGDAINTKLLVDSGASNSFSLYVTEESGVYLPPKTIDSFLGTGLNGEVFGKIGRVDRVKIHDVVVDQDPVVFYPDSESIKLALEEGDRQGVMGSDFLSRYRVIFNYEADGMLLRPTSKAKEEYSYNKAGLEVFVSDISPVLIKYSYSVAGMQRTKSLSSLPFYEVSQVRKGSPADEAGILPGDLIRQVNTRRAYLFTLNELIDILEGGRGNTIRITVTRDDKQLRFFLRLKDEIALDS